MAGEDGGQYLFTETTKKNLYLYNSNYFNHFEKAILLDLCISFSNTETRCEAAKSWASHRIGHLQPGLSMSNWSVAIFCKLAMWYLKIILLYVLTSYNVGNIYNLQYVNVYSYWSDIKCNKKARGEAATTSASLKGGQHESMCFCSLCCCSSSKHITSTDPSIHGLGWMDQCSIIHPSPSINFYFYTGWVEWMCCCSMAQKFDSQVLTGKNFSRKQY